MVLTDSFVHGTWKVEKSKKVAHLEVIPFEPPSKENRDGLSAEGERLLQLIAERDGVTPSGVRFTAPDGNA